MPGESLDSPIKTIFEIIMNEDNKSWGGARPGSGRKPGVRTAEPKIMVNVRLTAAEREKALKIGNGNASAGLREALKRVRA